MAQPDASTTQALRREAGSVERDAHALLAVFLQDQAGVEDRVSAPQLRALTLLRDRGQVNLGELADGLGVRPSSATRLCDRLAAAGLLIRKVAPHSRREIVLALSRHGRDLLAELEEHRREQIGAVLTTLTPADRAALLTGLAAYGEAVRTARAAAVGQRSSDVAPPAG